MIAHDSADNGKAVAVVVIVVVVEDGRGRWTKSVRRNVTDYDSRRNKNTNAVWLTGREAQTQLRLTVARVSRFLQHFAGHAGRKRCFYDSSPCSGLCKSSWNESFLLLMDKILHNPEYT